MNAERFAQLAEIWGGAITRWPAAEQDGAFALLAEAPGVAGAALARARGLDEVLDAVPAASVSQALRDAVLAAAPRPRPARTPLWRWLTGAGVGAGLAAATAAGLIAGVSLSARSAPPSEDESMLASIYDNGITDDLGAGEAS